MASPSMSTESARRAVELARRPATDSVRNIAALIHSTTCSTRRCSRGISRTSQQSSTETPPKKLPPAAGGAGRRCRRFGLVPRLGAADLGQGGFLQRLADVVTDPLAVPPLERRDGEAVDQHLVVQVIAEC